MIRNDFYTCGPVLFPGQTITVPVEVIRKHTSHNLVGYGLKFNLRSLKQSLAMAKVINVLKKSQREFHEEKVKLVV